MRNDNCPDRENEKFLNDVQIQNMGNFPPGEPPRFPGMNEPRSAPPNFIPEAPNMERRFAPGSEEGRPEAFFGGPGRPERGRGPGAPGNQREEFRVRPRELRGCLRRFTYIWLFSGDDFWFFPTDIDNMFVRGFRWRRNRWVYDRIFIRRIFFFRCF